MAIAQTQVTASAPGTYPVRVSPNAKFNDYFGSIFVTVPSGVTASYTVMLSGDPQSQNPTNLVPHIPMGISPQTASDSDTIGLLCTWVVLVVASVSGGSIVMNVVQAAPRL